MLETYSEAAVKRKRGLGDEKIFTVTYGLHDSKRPRNISTLISPISLQETKIDDAASEVEPTLESSFIVNTIESQFCLEILLKHKELRLIDQELAKCQVALEQLRRCHLIPYLKDSKISEAKLNVSSGTSPAICQDNEIASWAPPFGVTDGPYTRHYASWLIPDPSFDGVARQDLSKSCAGETVSERLATRQSSAEGMSKVGKMGLRGTNSQKHHTLSQVRDKGGPCILKRGDGQTVKLVCELCGRENFLSTQGFINHSRILHQRGFKSHVDAADACGQPVKFDETGCLIGNKDLAINSDLVHPLIRNAPTGREARDACKALLARVADSKAMLREGRLPGFTAIPKSVVPTPHLQKFSFLSSSKPNLSELLHRKGFSSNLDEIIDELRQQIDIEEITVEEESDDSEKLAATDLRTRDSRELHTSPFSSLTRKCMPACVDQSPSSCARVENSKYSTDKELKEDLRKTSLCYSSMTLVPNKQKFPATPCPNFTASNLSQNDAVGLKLISDSKNDLSPHTINSYNAPSLVSDDGDFDEDIVEYERYERYKNGADAEDTAEIGIEEDIEPRTVLRDNDSEGEDEDDRLLRKDDISMSHL